MFPEILRAIVSTTSVHYVNAIDLSSKRCKNYGEIAAIRHLICYESSETIGEKILIFSTQQVDVTENHIIRAKKDR